jgi:heparan-alpha-glucosaminide N-acetyltransferase
MTTRPERLLSLDAFRGFVILAMIWVNYIAGMPGIPCWLEHAGPRADGITLPDLVFPAFLFMAGMAIPLALRRALGQVTLPLLGRLCWRAASLMVAGVVLANAYRYDPAALLPRAWYLTLFYVAMLLLWRQGGKQWQTWLGGALILSLLALFRGHPDADFPGVYLQHGWWGILGMIGWAYLVCSLLYLATGGSGMALMGCLAGLLAVYLGGTAGALPQTALVNVPQVLGSTAANMMAGALAAHLLLYVPSPSPWRRVASLAWLAGGLFATGMLLRPYHGINKIQATESYTLVCSGLVLALFLLFYVLIDVLRWRGWCAWLLPAGGNALFAYIAPDLWDQSSAALHLPRWWWPWLEQGGTAGLLNAAAVALAMMGLTALAGRAGLRLKF